MGTFSASATFSDVQVYENDNTTAAYITRMMTLTSPGTLAIGDRVAGKPNNSFGIVVTLGTLSPYWIDVGQVGTISFIGETDLEQLSSTLSIIATMSLTTASTSESYGPINIVTQSLVDRDDYLHETAIVGACISGETLIFENYNGSTIATVTVTEFITPVGSEILYAGTITPTEYFKSDGSAVSRTTYSSLFSVIATIFGNGDGSTTFNIPDRTLDALSDSIYLIKY